MSSVCSSSSNQHQRRKLIRIDEVVTSTNESPFVCFPFINSFRLFFQNCFACNLLIKNCFGLINLMEDLNLLKDEEERPLLLESNVEIEVTSKRAVSFFAALKIPVKNHKFKCK